MNVKISQNSAEQKSWKHNERNGLKKKWHGVSDETSSQVCSRLKKIKEFVLAVR